MTAYLYLSAFKDFGRFRRVGAWILVGFLFIVVAKFWGNAMPHSTALQTYVQVSGTILLRMLALVSLIMSTSVISQEIEQKTIVYLLTRPISRTNLLVARYLASATLVSLIGCWMALCLMLGTLGLGGFSNPVFWRDIAAIILGAFAYGSVFTLISLLFNRAMLVGIIYAFGWELFVSNMPGDQFYLAIMSYLNGVANHPAVGAARRGVRFLAGDFTGAQISPMVGTIVLIGISTVLTMISARWFSTREFVPREDAE